MKDISLHPLQEKEKRVGRRRERERESTLSGAPLSSLFVPRYSPFWWQHAAHTAECPVALAHARATHMRVSTETTKAVGSSCIHQVSTARGRTRECGGINEPVKKKIEQHTSAEKTIISPPICLAASSSVGEIRSMKVQTPYGRPPCAAQTGAGPCCLL